MGFKTFQRKRELAHSIEGKIADILHASDAIAYATRDEPAGQRASDLAEIAGAMAEMLELIQLVDMPGDQG